MEPRRLFESPFTDHAPTGPDYMYPDSDVQVIVDAPRDSRRTASVDTGGHNYVAARLAVS
jgi:type I restriction enzyme R subunit